MDENKIIEDVDILLLYNYLIDYEQNIKKDYGRFNIYHDSVNDLREKEKIYFGSINRQKHKDKSEKSENYILWKEGSIDKKKAKTDRAHSLLRRIRNAFAHGNVNNKNGVTFEIKDFDEKNGEETLHGVITHDLLYELIKTLKNTKIEDDKPIG